MYWISTAEMDWLKSYKPVLENGGPDLLSPGSTTSDESSNSASTVLVKIQIPQCSFKTLQGLHPRRKETAQ